MPEGPRTLEGRLRAGHGYHWLTVTAGHLALLLSSPASLWLLLLWYASLLLLLRRPPLSGPAATKLALVCGSVVMLHGLLAGVSVGTWTGVLLVAQLVLILRLEPDGGGRGGGAFLVSFVLLLALAAASMELTFLVPWTLFLVGWVGTTAGGPGRVALSRRRLLALAASVAILTVPLFLVFPRGSFTVFTGTPGPTLSGFSDQISLGDLTRLLSSDRLVMRVSAARGARWRGTVLSTYTGRGWEAAFRGTPRYGPDAASGSTVAWLPPQGTAGRGPFAPAEPPYRVEPPPADAEDLFRQDVILEPMANRTLFAAFDPAGVETLGPPGLPAVIRRADDVLFRTDTDTTRRLVYTVWSRTATPPPTVLRRAAGPVRAHFGERHYVALPPLAPRVADLARRIVDDARATTFFTQAEAVEAWLTGDGRFDYSLEPPSPGSMDPVEHFLFEGRRGHCELFASAMVILLRSVGVPSRVVVGFAPGEPDLFGGGYRVLEAHAHAWTDVYVPGHGWQEFDPTPGGPRTPPATGLAAFLGLDRYPWLLRVRALADALDAQWQRSVIVFSKEHQRGLGEAAWALLRGPLTTLRGILPYVAGLVALVLLAGPLRRRLPGLSRLLDRLRRSLAGLARRRSSPRGDDPWSRVLRAAHGAGLATDPSWTAREVAAALTRTRPGLGPHLDALRRLHEEERYGGRAAEPARRQTADDLASAIVAGLAEEPSAAAS